jgi:hypothetical protein
MKWETPKLVDLADRQNTMNAVGFSNIPGPGPDVRGWTCQNGSTHSLFCFTGGAASIGKGGYEPPV